MKKNKFIYSLSAIALACIISFSGIGNSYIQVHATSVGIEKGVWNDDVSAWENIRQYIKLFASAYGIYVNPSWQTILWGIDSHNDFYNFMISDGYSEEEAEEIVHGGGGHVRDGITVDDGGNVTYSDEVCDLFHGYIFDYLESNSGYVLLKTIKASDVDVSNFPSEARFTNFITTLDNFEMMYVEFTPSGTPYRTCFIPTEDLYCSDANTMILNLDGNYGGNLGYVCKASSYPYATFYVIEEDGNYHSPYWFTTSSGGSSYTELNFSVPYNFENLFVSKGNNSTAFILAMKVTSTNTCYKTIFSNDGRNIKVWYSLDAFNNYDVGNQMYYATDSFNNYDSMIDNSTTITSQEFAYYYDNSSTIYQNIQNNINNYDGELDEKTVQDIVDSAVQDIKDSIANSGNQGGDDSSDSSDGGNGIGDLVDGIGKLLDTILSLIGKVMGVVADFTQSILDLFSGFTDFTDGFSNFLSAAFSFIPQEIWNVIQVGLSLMILLAVIKFLRK